MSTCIIIETRHGVDVAEAISQEDAKARVNDGTAILCPGETHIYRSQEKPKPKPKPKAPAKKKAPAKRKPATYNTKVEKPEAE